jgi:hypothetical protein
MVPLGGSTNEASNTIHPRGPVMGNGYSCRKGEKPMLSHKSEITNHLAPSVERRVFRLGYVSQELLKDGYQLLAII